MDQYHYQTAIEILNSKYDMLMEKPVVPNKKELMDIYNLANENEFFGVSNTEVQYNRACREHFNYFEWKKKQEAEE